MDGRPHYAATVSGNWTEESLATCISPDGVRPFLECAYVLYSFVDWFCRVLRSCSGTASTWTGLPWSSQRWYVMQDKGRHPRLAVV